MEEEPAPGTPPGWRGNPGPAQLGSALLACLPFSLRVEAQAVSAPRLPLPTRGVPSRRGHEKDPAEQKCPRGMSLTWPRFQHGLGRLQSHSPDGKLHADTGETAS